MKCLLTYKWVKLPRAHIPSGKGLMGSYLRLASRAAFRSGTARYCGYINKVEAGSWVGGIVGLKSILGIKDRRKALEVMDQLAALRYITYSLDAHTKKLAYTITDWIVECSGEPCADGVVYTTDGYGFLCVPRNITERLIERGYVFSETDAWLDLWCHTVWGYKYNAFSRLAPVIQFNRTEPVLTLERMGARWGWEKTKVWRFFQKCREVFALHKLPGSYGCLVFNQYYPAASGQMEAPADASIKRILNEIRFMEEKTHLTGSDHERMNRMTLWFSNRVNLGNLNDGCPSQYHPAVQRVVLFGLYNTRAYSSLPKKYDCGCVYGYSSNTGYSPPMPGMTAGVP